MNYIQTQLSGVIDWMNALFYFFWWYKSGCWCYKVNYHQFPV